MLWASKNMAGTKNMAGKALALWRDSIAFAKRTPTTTGIGNTAILYRACLRLLKANTKAVRHTRESFLGATVWR